MNGTCTGAIFWVPTPWGLGEGPKGQISLNLNYKVNFKGFKTKLCVSSHKWNIYNISDGIFIRPPGSSPGVGLGVPWGVGGKKFFFSEIQPDFVCELLTWMAHAPAQFFGSPPPPGALGRVKGSITVRFLWERGDLRWRAIECVLVKIFDFSISEWLLMTGFTVTNFLFICLIYFEGISSHIDDEYKWAGVEDPKIMVTTSRDPSSKLKQFAKVYTLSIKLGSAVAQW